MKIENKITLIAIIVLVLTIILASFVGIYCVKNYKVKNVLPKFLTSMEFNNTRNIKMEADEEEDSLLTQDNFEQSKSIIINKLNDLKVKQYILRQNLENGTIELQIPENEDTEKIVTILNQSGKFEIKDDETDEVLLDKSHIAKTYYEEYPQNDNSVFVALKIELNKEGKKIFSDISNKYIKTTKEVTDEETGQVSEEEVTLNISVNIDNQTYLNDYFRNDVKSGLVKYLDASNGTIIIPIGVSKEQSQLNKYKENVDVLRIILDNKQMPISYSLTDEIQSAELSNINIFICIGVAILLILFIINIYKYKLNGLILSLIQIGYIAFLILLLRYAKVFISIEGMCALAFVAFINFIFGLAILKNIDNVNVIFKKYLLNFIPLYVLAIVFSFGVIVNLVSVGNILFWGLLIMFIYNLLITKTVFKIINNKKGKVK